MKAIFNIIKTNYKKSFDFKGRQGRKEYWIFFLFSLSFFYLLVFLIEKLDYSIKFIILSLVLLIPLFSSSARRLHDGEKGDKKKYIGIWFGFSFLLVNFFNIKLGSPYISLQALWIIVFIFFQCRESNPKANAYGKLEKFG